MDEHEFEERLLQQLISRTPQQRQEQRLHWWKRVQDELQTLERSNPGIDTDALRMMLVYLKLDEDHEATALGD